jgi:hypothetical protein
MCVHNEEGHRPEVPVQGARDGEQPDVGPQRFTRQICLIRDVSREGSQARSSAQTGRFTDPAVEDAWRSAACAGPLGFKDGEHLGVAPPVTQQEGVPQPPFVFHSQLPENGRGGKAAGIAGREDAV